ncbi:MAG: bifunctional folylpolyglutamate synthase/dihydrofolate synthase [Defluviitaleaceae bacterium]|nr:bifunctional folylpolyglutamate synthase/dihydrofolate synthase [Defluviitaleaceae bacterium]
MNETHHISTIEQAMEFIYSTSWKGSELGLSRITELMRLLGEPQKETKFVHIAGTNGKGSTAAMLENVLSCAKYKTGLFTSPYIQNFGEMLRVNGVPISDDEIIKLANSLREQVGKMSEAPTEYEIITAMALLHFKQKECDIVVLEVGLGGRLDCTNVIDTPEIAIITAIGLDHMAQLGNTVEKIAAEKAGIIKKNGVVICHPQEPTVMDVIRKKCNETNSTVFFANDAEIIPGTVSLDGQEFSYPGGNSETYKIPLLGKHQLRNAAVVIETAKALGLRGREISQAAIKNGLKGTIWPGRFEILRKNPVFIADVAHNPQGIASTLETLKTLTQEKKFTFIFGVLADKDYKKMAELLIPHAKRFILTAPENPRALKVKTLYTCINNLDKSVPLICSESILHAVSHALETSEPGEIICALGSLSMIGILRHRLIR